MESRNAGLCWGISVKRVFQGEEIVQSPKRVSTCQFLLGALESEECVWVWVWLCVSCSVMMTLYNPMKCSPPGSSVHGVLQARRLEWVVIPFSRGSS